MLNEHHQNVYGLAASPNIVAAALTQATKKGRIVVLGNLLPLHMNPMRVAEEYAMLDMMSGGRIVAGFAPGGGPETFNYDVPSARSREQFWESLDVTARAECEEGVWYFLKNCLKGHLRTEGRQLTFGPGEQVAPRLREYSAKRFAERFPESEQEMALAGGPQ